MQYDASSLKTPQECDAALEILTALKDKIENETTNEVYDKKKDGATLKKLDSKIAIINGKILGVQGSIANLPDGQEKSDKQNELSKLNSSLYDALKSRNNHGGVADINNQLAIARNANDLVEVNGAIVAVNARKTELTM